MTEKSGFREVDGRFAASTAENIGHKIAFNDGMPAILAAEGAEVKGHFESPEKTLRKTSSAESIMPQKQTKMPKASMILTIMVSFPLIL